MGKVKVTFTAEKAEGLEVRLILSSTADATVKDLTFASGDEVRYLEAGATYVGQWHIIGKDGDKLTVTWKSKSLTGTLISGHKIDKTGPTAQSYPGGLWLDHGISTFLAPRADG